MIKDGVIRSCCRMCNSNCGILVYVRDGKVEKIKGDPHNPRSKGSVCPKCLSSPEYLYHPDRLRHPLKRLGERGEGRWKQISWDQALDEVANGLSQAKEEYGAESVTFMKGYRGLTDSYLRRFANVFGSPNVTGVGHICMMPRLLSSGITFGFNPIPDYEFSPQCIVIWAFNPPETHLSEYVQIKQALKKGARSIVIDPVKNKLATHADVWLPVRPGADLALALSMINVIINEALFDQHFVDQWTVGFDELKDHVQEYSPEKVEAITWIESEKIREGARFYASNRPACIQVGNGVEHNLNAFQTMRAIAILKAITGNLQIPGGDMDWSLMNLLALNELTMADTMPAERRSKRVDSELKLMPILTDPPPQSVIKAINEGSPYPIRVAYVQASNPLLTHSNARESYRALKKLDFLAVADMFMTPTAALADIVLPVATYLEFDSIVTNPDSPLIQAQQKAVEVPGCWPDLKILNELAKRVGLGQYFWDDEQEPLNEVLGPSGLSFKEFREIGSVLGVKQYRKYETAGFDTPSGKVELYSSQLEAWGMDPLPTYYELPETPYSEPDISSEYPLIFTSWKSGAFRHSEGRHIPRLRRIHPEPLIHIHPSTAEDLGIKEGDWVYVETKRGRIRQKATVTPIIHPRVVAVDYGWWFPERGPSELYGWAESNVNLLTEHNPPYGREMGATNLRGISCRVRKA
jgi:anaerobic selenocysteine-containing dehydrogenase